MVNWEQVINEMELPELPPRRSIGNFFDGRDGDQSANAIDVADFLPPGVEVHFASENIDRLDNDVF